MVQMSRLVLRPGVGSGRSRVPARCFILPHGFQGRGPTFTLGERYPLWRIPVLCLHVSAA